MSELTFVPRSSGGGCELLEEKLLSWGGDFMPTARITLGNPSAHATGDYDIYFIDIDCDLKIENRASMGGTRYVGLIEDAWTDEELFTTTVGVQSPGRLKKNFRTPVFSSLTGSLLSFVGINGYSCPANITLNVSDSATGNFSNGGGTYFLSGSHLYYRLYGIKLIK